REVLDQIDRSTVLARRVHLVQLPLDDRVDVRRQALEPARGELRLQHLAQPGVVRRIREAETAWVLLRGGPWRLADQVAEVVAERLDVAQHRPGLRISGDQPDVHTERNG